MADELSYELDKDDWKITTEFFAYLNQRWVPFTFDRFASSSKKHLEKFNSKFYCPGTLAVDALTQDWSKENNLLVPPVSLISDVIKHILSHRVYGALIIPYCKSARFWPMIVSPVFQAVVKDNFVVMEGSTVIKHGKCTFSLLGSSNFKGPMLALKVQF